MIKVTVETKHKTHVFNNLPLDWDSVVGPVDRIHVQDENDELLFDAKYTEGLRIFGCNSGFNDMLTGITKLTFVCGYISEGVFAAWEIHKDGRVKERADFEPIIRPMLHQEHQKVIK